MKNCLVTLLLFSLQVSLLARAQEIEFKREYNYASESIVNSYLYTDITLNNRYCALARNAVEILGSAYQSALFGDDTWQCDELDGKITLSVMLAKPNTKIGMHYLCLHPFHQDLTEPEKDFVIAFIEDIFSTIDTLAKGSVKSWVSNDKTNYTSIFDLSITPLYEVHLGTRSRWGCSII